MLSSAARNPGLQLSKCRTTPLLCCLKKASSGNWLRLNPKLAVVTNSRLRSFLLFGIAEVHVVQQYPSNLLASSTWSLITDQLDLQNRRCPKIPGGGHARFSRETDCCFTFTPLVYPQTGCKLLTCLGKANHRFKGFLQKRGRFLLAGLERPSGYYSLLDFERRYRCGRSAYGNGHTYAPPVHWAGGRWRRN